MAQKFLYAKIINRCEIAKKFLNLHLRPEIIKIGQGICEPMESGQNSKSVSARGKIERNLLRDPKGIRNIVFDLGGVIIDLDRDRAVRSLEILGLKDADSMLGLYRQEEPFLGLETGRLTVGEFFDLLRRECPGATDADLACAFNNFLVVLPAERLEALCRLRQRGYKVFALSNTNPVMYNSWIAQAFRQQGKTINDYFDGIVTSFQELICKPDPDIFKTVLNRYNLEAGATLMLDDSEANCEAAAGVGMMAWRVGREKDNDMLAYSSILLDYEGD